MSPTRDVVTDSSAAVCEIFDSLIAGKLTRATASYTVSEQSQAWDKMRGRKMFVGEGRMNEKEKGMTRVGFEPTPRKTR